MKNDRTPHNFLLHLRSRAPWCARLMDGARALSFVGGVLTIKTDTSVWPGSELNGRLAEVTAEAARFFGGDARVELVTAPQNAEYLPFAVNASKYWNHAAFISFDGAGVRLLAARKPFYALKMIKGEMVEEDWAETLRLTWDGDPADPVRGLNEVLPELFDLLCAFSRENFSYAHIIAAFPGHEAADAIEARMYAIRDWGTPATPPAVLQKYVGRIHYVNPLEPPMGIKMSQALGSGNH